MKLITNINGEYLRDVYSNIKEGQVEEVRVAVAYASGNPELFDWCWSKNIPLKFWGRYDHSVPVTTNILKNFLDRKSFQYRCFMAQSFFHAKVIWFVGHGVFIGSHNLTDRAWYKNIEVGTFFTQDEIIKDRLDLELETFFRDLNSQSTELNHSIYDFLLKLEQNNNKIDKSIQEQKDKFEKESPIKIYEPNITITKKSALEKRKLNFLEDWNYVLGIMEKIAKDVTKKENYPSWIPQETPEMVVLDQFLHDFYYRVVKDPDNGNKYRVHEFHEKNMGRVEQALSEALLDWRDLKEAHSEEDEFINKRAKTLYEYLKKEKILRLNEEEFVELCLSFHSFWQNARYAKAKEIGLSEGIQHDLGLKANKLATKLYKMRSENNKSIQELLYYVLHDGAEDQTPHRFFEVLELDENKVDYFGKSSYGELIGWGNPERFPPVNGRTLKALRSLGHDIII
mgnify:CR=1 FL=1